MWWRVNLEMRCRWGRIPSRGGVMVESKIFRMSRSISSAYSPRCYLKRACLKSVLLIVGGILFAAPVGGFGSDRSNSSAAASGFDGPAELRPRSNRLPAATQFNWKPRLHSPASLFFPIRNATTHTGLPSALAHPTPLFQQKGLV